MPDIRLVQHGGFPDETIAVDFGLLLTGGLDETQALATAAIVAIASNGRADVSDVLPDPDATDREGWWGDLDAEEIWGGWPLGSRLWLLRRAKITPPGAREGATVHRVEDYIRECLQPFIDRKIASAIRVQAERTDIDTIKATAVIFRGPEPAIELRYADLWDEIGGA